MSDEGDIAMDPMGDGARNSLRSDEDDVVIPGTPEPSIGRRMKRSLPSTGKPSKLNFVDVSVPGPSDNSPPTPDADIIFDNDDRSEAGVGDRSVIPEAGTSRRPCQYVRGVIACHMDPGPLNCLEGAMSGRQDVGGG